MARLEVRDGLWTVSFEGQLIASTHTEKRLPHGISWNRINRYDAKSYLRWVKMELFRVEKQADPQERIQLPDGGYFYHVIHHTVCYHVHGAACPSGYKGVPTDAATADLDLLPCRDCNPPMLWDPNPADPDNPALLCDPALIVDVEPVRHELYRETSALNVVNQVTGRRLTVPAGLLLEEARRNDAAIKAVYEA